MREHLPLLTRITENNFACNYLHYLSKFIWYIRRGCLFLFKNNASHNHFHNCKFVWNLISKRETNVVFVLKDHSYEHYPTYMEEYNISITNLSKLTIDGLKPLTSLEENDENFVSSFKKNNYQFLRSLNTSSITLSSKTSSGLI